jgi:hypothetical protein
VHRCIAHVAANSSEVADSRGIPVALDRLRVPHPAVISTLVILNLALQLFDGVATYHGWERFGEANPLLRAAFAAWGAGPTLVVSKLGAIALLLLLARASRRDLVGIGLVFTLTVYVALSLIPWSVRLLS